MTHAKLAIICILIFSQNIFAAPKNTEYTAEPTAESSVQPKEVNYKIAAQSMARTNCVMDKVTMYENDHGGLTPDEDTVDLFFDACINR